MLWQLGYYRESDADCPLPLDFQFPNPYEKVENHLPKATWVNHSTFWMECDGISLLVDPIWNERCSPVSFAGPLRRISPKPNLETISSLDFVIISHNHYDHLDKRTVCNLKKLHPQITWIVPPGVKRYFRRWFASHEMNQIVEIDWWDQLYLKGVLFTSVPAQHFSGRGIFDLNCSQWMGCVCEFPCKKRLYFAGDTGYNPYDFKEIGRKFRYMDLSLIPIGVYSPRKFMQPVHVNPYESLQIHQEVGSKLSIGGHWGTFKLSSEALARPPFDLYLALQKKQINVNEFRVLSPGQSINW